jgi:hypothetical protein
MSRQGCLICFSSSFICFKSSATAALPLLDLGHLAPFLLPALDNPSHYDLRLGTLSILETD